MVQETKVEYDKQYGSHKTTTAIMSNIKAAEYEDMFGLKVVIPLLVRSPVRVRR